SLYILCHFIITHFKKHTDFTAGKRAGAVGACTFTLAVALGAVLLLPFSIIAMRLAERVPHSRWVLGASGIGSLFSNMSLVFLMPFAYFFTESEGFAGSKKVGCKTSVVLLLLSLLVLGMVWVASAIVGNDAASRQSLYDLWEYYLPYLTPASRSLASCFCLCTPFGLSIMFTVTGKLLVKPRLLEDLDEQLSCTRFEEAAVSHRSALVASCWLNLDMEMLREQFFAIRSKRRKLELRHRASPWQRNLGYPLAMLGLLALTVSGPGAFLCSFVCFHVLELLLDDAAMPRGIQVPGQGDGTARHVPCCSGDHSSPTCSLLCLQELLGPGFLLHLWFLWSCTAGCPHFVSFRRGTAVPSESPVSPAPFPAPSLLFCSLTLLQL
uniref:Uncharacterized protein n=1 Tax=Malurus cyaneus samueli TaxID=2593467 RepID=A0A8C5U4K9_9PASS